MECIGTSSEAWPRWQRQPTCAPCWAGRLRTGTDGPVPGAGSGLSAIVDALLVHPVIQDDH